MMSLPKYFSYNYCNTSLKLSHIMLTTIVLFSIVITLRLIKYDYQMWSILRSSHFYNNFDYNLIEKIKPKIFCMITTRYENHETKAIHVRNTWGQRCDRLLFLSSESNSTLPAIKICGEDDRDHLWCKTKSGLRYVYEHYFDQFDWFLKADDDSYVIVENLRHFVSNYNPESPLYFGCKFKLNKVIYMSGGAGYVLSREALRRFIQKSISNYTDTSSCKAYTNTGAEDVELGKCLQNVGVNAGDSRDHSLKPRFFPFDPLSIILPDANINSIAPWFASYSVYPHKSGSDCCSETLISFHYVPIDIMYLIDFLLYNVTVVK